MGLPHTKGRYTVEKLDYSSSSGYVNNPTIGVGASLANTDRQVIETAGHPVSLIGKKTGLDIGGAFRSTRVTVEGGRAISGYSSFGTKPIDFVISQAGHYYASQDASGVCSQARTDAIHESEWQAMALPPATDLFMLSAGATAISRCAPTNPLVDLSTSLAELFREGLPSLPGRSGGLSSEYLNYNFGIAPLASDIRDLRNVMKHADALWDQYARNSGKLVRRRYTFPPQVTSVTAPVLNNRLPSRPAMQSETNPTALDGNVVRSGTLQQRTTTTTKTWFSGAFTYYLPDSPFGQMVARLDALYGLKPGVDTLYQLTPWSWLIDYFANLGDIIENLNSFTHGGLVMPYAYIMSETTVETRSYLLFELKQGTLWKAQSLSDVVRRVTKRRIPASPFGFGLSYGDLSAKQKSILIALGINLAT